MTFSTAECQTHAVETLVGGWLPGEEMTGRIVFPVFYFLQFYSLFVTFFNCTYSDDRYNYICIFPSLFLTFFNCIQMTGRILYFYISFSSQGLLLSALSALVRATVGLVEADLG